MEEGKEILALLAEIKTKMGEDNLSDLAVALIAAGGVLAGSLVTSIFQLITVKRSEKSDLVKLNTQLKAELISKQRQEWMDSVREKAADLLAEYDRVYAILTGKSYNNQDLLDKLYLSSSRNAVFIQLKLNPKKEKQKAVIDAIENLLMLFQCAMSKPDENHDKAYAEGREKYISSLNELFSETWQKVKNME